jgi:hypothetical protein
MPDRAFYSTKRCAPRAFPAKIIEFLHTEQLPKKREMGSPDRRGKIIEFASPMKKSA